MTTEIIHTPDARRMTSSPWGLIQNVTEIAPGIWRVSTASHGGLFLSEQRMALMPAELAETAYSKGPWFEEDCDAAFPMVVFPDAFRDDHVEIALATIVHTYPTRADAARAALTHARSKGERRAGVFGAGKHMIAAFKQSWTLLAHGLPDDLNCMVAHFEANGDLVDVEAFAVDGSPLDTHDFDGPALLALVGDIQKHGYVANPDIAGQLDV